MAIKLKELSTHPQSYTGGHSACTGCGCSVIVSQVIRAVEGPVVVGFATGCMEVVTTIYPYTAWKIPYIHSAFENVAATISGAEAAYRSLKKQGKLPHNSEEKIQFIAFGGDGGTYDIGLQALSGAMERGHDMLYVCYDNEGYMNTGTQRSGSTPMGTATSTTPAGESIPGKPQDRKDLTEIMIAHNIPYVAQASPHNWRDLMTKVRKGLAIEGPAFINTLGTCFRGWKFPQEDSIDLVRLATEICFWPLYEVEFGKWKLNYKPKNKAPIEGWLKRQGRFKHLFKPENKHIIEHLQEQIDEKWKYLLFRCGESSAETYRDIIVD